MRDRFVEDIVPSGHAKHDVTAGVLVYLPGGQSTQASMLVMLSEAWYMPAKHAVHSPVNLVVPSCV